MKHPAFTEAERYFAGKPIYRHDVRHWCLVNGHGRADGLYGDLVNARIAADTSRLEPPITLTTVKLNRQECPPSPVAIAVAPYYTSPDPVLVLSDLHIPSHNGPFIDRALDRAEREGCKSFIIAGDITDNNQHHAKRGFKRSERTWQQDIDLARSVLGHICARFPHPTLQSFFRDDDTNERADPTNVVFFGNHDEWIDNTLKGEMTPEWLYGYLFPDMPIKWTSYRQVRLYHGRRDWLIVHGEKFSHANPLGIVEKYALHYMQNVIMGHQHYAVQWQSGPYDLIINGGCFDRDRQDHLHTKPEPYRQTQNGYTIITDGVATLHRS